MKKPEKLLLIDITKLEKKCQDYIDFVDNDEEYHEDGDHDVYIFEAAMKDIFGKDVFEWINQRQEQL